MLKGSLKTFPVSIKFIRYEQINQQAVQIDIIIAIGY